jgi:hypothetical protein
MNRRGFLAALIGGATLDPERLLWRPGAKLISIPKVLGSPCWMALLDANGREISCVGGYRRQLMDWERFTELGHATIKFPQATSSWGEIHGVMVGRPRTPQRHGESD